MIAPMSRVELVCLRSIRAELVRTLQDRGLLHLNEVDTEMEAAPEFLNRVALEGDEYDEFVATEEAERTLSEVVSLLTTTPSEFDVQAATERCSALDQTDLFAQVQDWAEQLRETTRKRSEAQDQLDVLSNYKVVIEQVAPALGNDVKLGKGTRAVVLTGDVTRAVARIEERLTNDLEDTYKFHKNQTSKKQLVGLLTFPEDKTDLVSKILNQEGVAPMDMSSSDYSDLSAREVLEKINTTIGNLQAELGTLEGEANTISQQVGADVVSARTIISNAVARHRVAGNFAESEMVAVIQGWTPSDQFESLKGIIESEFAGKVDVNQIEAGDPHHTTIPTQLRNNKFVRPFEVCMSIFRPPAYGTIDPTAMVAVAFILFYGFILGDAIYAIALFGLAKLLGRKFGHIPAIKDVEKIATYMAASAFVFGVAFGEYCGNFVELWLWPKLFGTEFHLYLFHRAHETTKLLIYAIYIGIFHIIMGLVLGVREDFRHDHKKHAIEKLGMLMGLVALIIQAFAFFEHPFFTAAILTPVCVVLVVVGVALIFYAMGAMGFIGVIEIMSLGGNVLSYARLMALGVASIALADIANTMPGMMGYLIGIPVAFGVHLLNIGIGIASPTIHSLRLNFVEFLPKFYSPEGTGFAPFKKEKVS